MSDIDCHVNEANPAPLEISSSEFHLVRQILMLFHRKLDYVGKVVRSLRDYSTLELFEYVVMFSKPRDTRVTPRLGNATMEAREAGPTDFLVDANGKILEKNRNTVLRVPAKGKRTMATIY